MATRTPITVAVISAGTSDHTRLLLGRCLQSLQPAAQEGQALVWVVDNCSTDGSADLVRREFEWVRLLEPGTNLGYGRAVNLVAERTSSPWIVPANSDIEATPGALDALLRTGEADPRVGAVSPRLVYPNGTTQHSVHAFPSLGPTVAFNLGLQRLWPQLGDRLCFEGYWNPDRPRVVPWAVAAFLLVRREAFDDVGGFDPSQWMYTEDLDLGWRLTRGGWNTVHDPGAVVVHAGSQSTTAVWGDATVDRWSDASYVWMGRRWGGEMTRAIAAANVLGAGTRMAGFAVAALRDARFAQERDRNRAWLRRHRRGLRPGQLASPQSP